MNFGEILDRSEFYVWGNSPVPSGSRTVLTGDEGFIADAHRRLQQDYNYWLMRANSVITTVSGTQAYALPTLYKEMIGCVFKEQDEDYFREPLKPLDMYEPYESLWQGINSSEEYPRYYEVVDSNIVLYNPPNAARSLHVIYWTYLARPTSFTDNTATGSDDLTAVAGDIIAKLAATKMLNVLDEFGKSQVYAKEADEQIRDLRKQDRKNRQAYLKFPNYGF